MSTEITTLEQEQRFWELHGQIKTHGEAAALHLVEFAKALKAMRDEKAYVVAGYDEFAEYTEREFGIGQTQAYSYIQALEGLGEKLMADNAGLGITRLKLLASLPRHMQESFIGDNDVGEMSTRALQADIAALKQKLSAAEEQLTIFADDNVAQEGDVGMQSVRIEQLTTEIDLLRGQLQAANEAAATAQDEASAARGENEEDIKRLVDEEVKKQVKKQLKAQEETHERELKRTRDAAEQNAKAAAAAERVKLQQEMEKKNEERRAALAKAADLEGKLKIAGSEAITRASVLFEEMQIAIRKMLEAVQSVAKENPENGKKLADGVDTVLRDYLRELEAPEEWDE